MHWPVNARPRESLHFQAVDCHLRFRLHDTQVEAPLQTARTLPEVWCEIWGSQVYSFRGFPGGPSDNPPANPGDIRDSSLIPGSGRSPGGRHGNPLQYSCLENPMDKGA